MKLLTKLLYARTIVAEGVESFFLNLSNPSNATFGDNQGVGTINQVGILNPIIATDRSSGVAPLAVLFDAKATQVLPSMTTLPFHEIYYAWTFGDPASGATWSYGAKAGTSSKNIAYGPVAAHCFETPGTYTITLWVYHLSSIGVLTARNVTSSVTVTNPDTVFSGTNTICVANGTLPVAGVDGVPAGALCVNQSNWATIVAYATSGKRVLLKRGDSWLAGLGTAITSQTTAMIGAYGSGAKPLLTLDQAPATAGLYLFGTNDIRIVDLSITSPLSSGSTLRGIRASGLATNTLLLRCEVTHTQYAIEGDGCTGYYVFDSYVHDLNATDNGIGMYHHTCYKLAIIGSRFSNIPGNHGVRLQGLDTAVISNNQFDGASGHQLTVRGMQDNVEGTWTGTWTQDVVISDNLIDGSLAGQDLAALYVGPVNQQHAERCRNVISERNFIRAVNGCNILMGCASGATVRNNICIVTGYDYSLAVGGNIGLLSLPPSSTWIYNNTFYKPDASLTTRFSAIWIGSGGAYAQATGTVITNNLAYGPGNSQDAGQSIGVTTGTFISAPNVPGGAYTLSNNSTNAQVHGTRPWVAVSPSIATEFAPSNYGLNSGVFVPVNEDYFSATITGTREIGAIQV